MPSIHDVARRAKVSTATVSRAFSGAQNLRPATRDLVFKIARQLNYAPDPSARNLSRRREGRDSLTYTIGLISTQSSLFGLDPFSAEMLSGMEDALRERGFTIRLVQCEPNGSALPSVLTNRGVDGAVCFDRGPIVREIARLVPTVTMDWHDPEADAYSVIPDYRSGAYQAVKALLHTGHRTIEVLTGAPGESPLPFHSQVHQGCVKAFEEAGLKFKPSRDTHLPGNAPSGYVCGKEIFARPTRPDAVIASDGAMPGLFRAAYEAGLRIPQDVSFIGIDGVSAMEYLWPPLTTVDTHIRSLGTQAVKTLIEMILSGERKRGVEITPVTFVQRASVRL